MSVRERVVLQMIQECLRGAAGHLAGHQVLLFGSRATGRASACSDFDLGVVGEQPLPLAQFYQVSDLLEALPTLYTIEWVDLNRASPAFRRRACAEGRLLYG